MDSLVNLKIALILTSLCAVTSASRSELAKDLLQNYEKGIQPNDNATTVEIDFIPQRIIEFDEKIGKFAMSGYLEVYWEDPRIAMNWALSSHQSPDIESMYFSESEVWTPHFQHVNSFSRFDAENMYESSVLFSLNGSAFMSKREIFTSKCKVDFLRFPYETQYCSIELEVLGYYMDEINLTSVHEINFEYYDRDVTWNLKSIKTMAYVTVDTNSTRRSASIRFRFELKRATSYFSIIVMMPMFLMVQLQCLCFAIPRKSGERTGISMTVILALAIYLTIVTNFIPQSSRSGVPFMIIWVFGGLLCACVIHVFVIISLHPPEIIRCILPTTVQGYNEKNACDYLLAMISGSIFILFWQTCNLYLYVLTSDEIP